MAYSIHDLQDTIVALATPPGVGAIGVIRLSGKDAITIANSVFHGKDLSKQAGHTAHFGTIRDDSGRIVDEVLATVFVAPKSYTGEHVVEVSCHGSNYIIQELIRLFIQKGARTAQRGEFTLRAFLNSRMDLSQAEAVADLIASDSEQSHALALQQMRGGISDEIADLRQQLLDFASLIELELDFSEEDVEFANRDELRQLVEKIQRLIRQLLDSFRLGNAIKQGITTVIAGRPNAGKSTLLNALLNEERAIVSEIAGTTRDTIEEVLNINGILFRIVDTAGIREAQDQIEAIGVEKTLEKVRQSSLLVYVYDVVNTPEAEVEKDLEKLTQEGIFVIVVGNKVDLAPPRPSRAGRGALHLSAKHKQNINALKEALYEAVISEKASLDNQIISNARHFEALEKAYTSLTDVLHGMDQGITSDFVAMDIRRALSHLGEITGEVTTDDLLGNIFGRFCIGK